MSAIRGVVAAALLCAVTSASYGSSLLDEVYAYPKLTASDLTIHFDAASKQLTIDGSGFVGSLTSSLNALPSEQYDLWPGEFHFSTHMTVDGLGNAAPDTTKASSLQIYGTLVSSDGSLPDPGDTVFANSTQMIAFEYGRNANTQLCFAFYFVNPSASNMLDGFDGYNAYEHWVGGPVKTKVFVQGPAEDPNFLYDFTYAQNVKADIVPLPGAWALGGAGLLALAGMRRLRRSSR